MLSPVSLYSSQSFADYRRRTSSNSFTEEAAVLEAQLEEVRDAIDGTCQWIEGCEDYKVWRSSTKPSDNVLVIVGDLSTGKSVLTKSIYKRLDGSHVIPFFCDAESPKRDSMQSVIASFIYYAISRSHQFADLITDRRLERNPAHSFDELWSLFLSVMGHPQAADHVFLVDGIDQCKAQSLRQLQVLLVQSKTQIRGKLLMTTRPDEYPDLISPSHLSIQIQSEHLSSDLAIFLDQELRHRNFSQAFTKEMVELVKRIIGDEVRGMFLLIEGKLREFDEARDSGALTDEAAMRQTLGKFPKLMEEYFLSVLKPRTMVGDDALRGTTVVLSVLLAVQQQYLSDKEIWTILNSASVVLPRGLDILWSLRRTWGPFVDIPPPSGGHRHVGVVHPTYRTFLAQTGSPNATDPVLKLLGHVDLKLGHAILAKACLKRLMDNDVNSTSQQPQDHVPFLPYSLRHWSTHFRECGDSKIENADLLLKFLNPASAGYASWSIFVRGSRTRPGTTSHWWRDSLPLAPALVDHAVPIFDIVRLPREAAGLPLLGDIEIDVNERDDFGTPALILALQSEQYDVAFRLLELGASADATDVNGLSALHLAVLKQRNDVLKTLLGKHASSDTETILPGSRFAKSPLLSSISASTDIFLMLLESRASNYARREDGWSILHESALRNDLEKSIFILERKLVSIDHATKEGYTPVMVAAGAGQSLSVVRCLLLRGATLSLSSTRGSTALYEAAYHGNAEIVSILLQYHAKVDARKSGWTPLLVSSLRGWEDVTQSLIEAGADVDATSDEGETALMVAVKQQRRGIVALLLQLGKADTEKVNHESHTALLLAASKPSLEILLLLLKFSKNPAKASRFHAGTWSCLHAAAFAGLLENVRHLVRARRPTFDVDELYEKYGWTPLLAALCHGHSAVAQLLLSYNAGSNQKSVNGWNVLHMACYYTTDETLLRRLLKSVDRPMLSAMTEKGSTPLSIAAEKGFTAAVRILISEYNVDTLLRNELGRTPLYYAANAGSSSCVDLLMATRHFASVRSENGWTALHAACKKCPTDTIERLAAVTNWNDRYQVGLTPMHIAIEHGNNGAVAALLKAGISSNIPSEWGTSPLLEAATTSNIAVVDKLLETGASLDEFDAFYFLPLHGAYISKAPHLLKRLRPSPNLRPRLLTKNLESFVHAAATHHITFGNAVGTRLQSTGLLSKCSSSNPSGYRLREWPRGALPNICSADATVSYRACAVLLTGWTPLHIAARFWARRLRTCVEEWV